jgi:cutinase
MEGVTTGPVLCTAMKKKYGNRLGCQGVDPKGYSAAIGDNGKPKGTADPSIQAGVKEFENAYKKCPNSLFVFSGYRLVNKALIQETYINVVHIAKVLR